MTQRTQPSQDEIFRAANALFKPGDVIELRIPGSRNGREVTTAGYFDDFLKLAQTAARCSGQHGVEGIYWTLNPCNPALLARCVNHVNSLKNTTSDKDIRKRAHLLIDCDPVRPKGISSTNEEKALAEVTAERVRNHLRDAAWPEPFVADSGNGYHLIYPVDLPNDDSARDLLKACLEALAATFDTDKVKIDRSVFNASRICKVYGTLAAKGDSTSDRPHRVSHLLHVPEQVQQTVSRDLLEALASKAPKRAAKPPNSSAGRIAPEKAEEFLALAGIEHRGRVQYGDGWKWQLQRCWFDASHTATSVIVTLGGNGALGYHCSHASCNGNDWRKFREEVEKKLGRKFYFIEGRAPGGGFVLTPISDLLARPDVPVEYVVENLLVAGTVACIVAKPKVGKSTFARNLCLAVSRGVDFLGLKTKQGKCIYLALEEREEDIKNDFRSMGADGSEPIDVYAAAAPAEGIDAACDLVRQHRPRLIVIDPLFRLARIRDEKAYAETYAALGPLIDVAREVGTLVVLVHHAGKSVKADAIDSPLGSTAIGGAVCTVVLLKKQTESGTRTLQTVTRIGQEMPETVLRFDPASRSLSLGAQKDEADVQAAEEAILEYLKSLGEPKTEPEIDEAVEGKTGLKRRALRALATHGKVTRDGGGKKGDPYRYTFSFSCSQDIAGTREQETENRGQTVENKDRVSCSQNSQDSILVPVPGEQQKRFEEGEL